MLKFNHYYNECEQCGSNHSMWSDDEDEYFDYLADRHRGHDFTLTIHEDVI